MGSGFLESFSSLIFESVTKFTDNNPWKVLGVVLTIAASSAIVSMFTPQFLATFRTKNTSGLNKTMFTINMIATFCFAVAALLALIDHATGAKPSWHMYIILSMFTLLNSYTFSLSSYMIFVKVSNENKASELGLTEIEYYKQHLEQ